MALTATTSQWTDATRPADSNSLQPWQSAKVKDWIYRKAYVVCVSGQIQAIESKFRYGQGLEWNRKVTARQNTVLQNSLLSNTNRHNKFNLHQTCQSARQIRSLNFANKCYLVFFSLNWVIICHSSFISNGDNVTRKQQICCFAITELANL